MDFDLFAAGLGFTEGPVSMEDGSLWITSVSNGALYRLDSGGTLLETVDTGGGPNGLAVDDHGHLFVAQNGGIFGGRTGTEPGIQRVVDGEVEHIVTGVGAPNDLCFGPDGRLYFTDPRGESDPRDPDTAQPGRLYSCDREGGDLQVVLEGPRFINGLGFSPNGDVLFVVETSKPHRILRLDFDARSRVLGEPEEFIRIDAGFPDGLAVDVDGGIWVAATYDTSIHSYDAEGRLREKLDCGPDSTPTNCCFGSVDPSVLYVTASDAGAVLRTTTKSRGLPLYPFR